VGAESMEKNLCSDRRAEINTNTYILFYLLQSAWASIYHIFLAPVYFEDFLVCNNGGRGGGGIFSKVKRFVAKWIGTLEPLLSSF